MLNASRVKEILDHVKDKQRLHSIVREAFPCFGERQIPKPLWMPKEISHMIFRHQGRSIFRLGDRGHC